MSTVADPGGVGVVAGGASAAPSCIDARASLLLSGRTLAVAAITAMEQP